MVKLSGILEYSMGGFLCLRGFADYKTLARISKENPDVQRSLIEEHKGEMAKFLNKGLYRFFPEVVLSVSLLSNQNYAEIERFFETVRTFGSWKENLGNINISIFNHEAGDKNRVAHFTFDESSVQLNRVDGNHRLSAADEVVNSFKVPFCLVLCRNTDEESQYSRAIFHNINSKQIPLKLEENLKVILTSENAFSNDVLKTDPSFGWAYYLARVTAKKINFSDYPFINMLIQQDKYTFLVEVFDSLIKSGYLPEDECSLEKFSGQLPEIDHALRDAQLHSLPQNIAVIGALSFYKLTDQNKYHRFICWIKENCIADAPNIHMHDLISIYDKVYENSPKTVFISMKFGVETEDTYQAIKDIRDILKRENNFDLKIIRVDDHEDGYSDEIYHRIIDGIRESSLVIADLSYGNKNVHHEIGYAQGIGKKVLLIYQSRDGVDSKKEIGSNISMHDQLRFMTRAELRPQLLLKIRQFFGISSD
ncbi:MAG: hypothetical protein IJU56_07540 [Clostridia bacterium]|nr:hypothetical protein [Clostridia bacterium]